MDMEIKRRITREHALLTIDAQYIDNYLTCNICSSLLVEGCECDKCEKCFCTVCISKWL